MNRERLAAIRQKAPREQSLSGGKVFDSDKIWMLGQLEEAWAKIEGLEKMVKGAEEESRVFERALERQTSVARERLTLWDVSHKDTVHELVAIATRVLSKHGGT